MKSLCLEGNTVGVEAAEAIASALEKHPEFQVRPNKLCVYRSREEIFWHKIVNIFLFITFNMCFEYPQHMFCFRYKKIIFLITLIQGSKKSTRPLVFTSASGCRASESQPQNAEIGR